MGNIRTGNNLDMKIRKYHNISKIKFPVREREVKSSVSVLTVAFFFGKQ